MPALARVVAAAKPDKPAPMIWMGPACAMISHECGWFQGCGAHRSNMQEHIFIQEAPDSLDVDDSELCCIQRAVGQLFPSSESQEEWMSGEEVLRLEFDAWQEKLSETLHGLAKDASSKFGLHSIAMAHRTGSVGPGENIVAIHVASPHRKEAFEGCSWLIDELKRQAPLWKKEVKPSGETWKAGLG